MKSWSICSATDDYSRFELELKDWGRFAQIQLTGLSDNLPVAKLMAAAPKMQRLLKQLVLANAAQNQQAIDTLATVAEALREELER